MIQYCKRRRAAVATRLHPIHQFRFRVISVRLLLVLLSTQEHRPEVLLQVAASSYTWVGALPASGMHGSPSHHRQSVHLLSCCCLSRQSRIHLLLWRRHVRGGPHNSSSVLQGALKLQPASTP
jgi:hypothetical protein